MDSVTLLVDEKGVSHWIWHSHIVELVWRQDGCVLVLDNGTNIYFEDYPEDIIELMFEMPESSEADDATVV